MDDEKMAGVHKGIPAIFHVCSFPAGRTNAFAIREREKEEAAENWRKL
nr:hypothetical protein [uncultured Sellimonas sp.]